MQRDRSRHGGFAYATGTTQITSVVWSSQAPTSTVGSGTLCLQGVHHMTDMLTHPVAGRRDINRYRAMTGHFMQTLTGIFGGLFALDIPNQIVEQGALVRLKVRTLRLLNPNRRERFLRCDASVQEHRRVLRSVSVRLGTLNGLIVSLTPSRPHATTPLHSMHLRWLRAA